MKPTIVGRDFFRPLYVVNSPGDFERVFVVEKGDDGVGKIQILTLTTGQKNPQPFLSITVLPGYERGLLGLAFHPDYASNGYFYVNYTAPGLGAAGRTVVQRFTVSSDPNLADPNSAYDILQIAQPFENHNGGWIDFGPDGYLYIATGDGGAAGPSLDPDSLLGKLVRIDVNGDDFPEDETRNYAIPPTNPFAGPTPGADEVWALGLRNPWRCAFDALTGDLYIGDVGEASWEELSFQHGSSRGGEHYGWHCYEGLAPHTPQLCSDPNALVKPFLVYGHSQIVPPTNKFGFAVVGGFVYRGCEMPDLDGHYFFGDYATVWIMSLRYVNGQVLDVVDRTAALTGGPGYELNVLYSFGRDAFGEIYFCDAWDGEIIRIDPASPVGPDCNANGRRDTCDILSGFSKDLNGNGIPDECECAADLDGDGKTCQSDLGILLATYGLCEGQPGYNAAANLSTAGQSAACVDQADLGVLLADYGCGGCE